MCPLDGISRKYADEIAARRKLVRGVWPGLVGGLAADATSLLLQSERGTVVLPEIATDATSSTLQPRDFSFLLSNLGSNGKSLLFLGVLIIQVVTYTAVSVGVTMTLSRRRTVVAKARKLPHDVVLSVVGHVVVATSTFLLLTAILLWTTAAGMPARTDWFSYTLGALAAATVFAIVASLLRISLQVPEVESKAIQTVEAVPTHSASPAGVSRRRLLQTAGGLAVGVFATVLIGRQVWGHRGGGTQRSTAGSPTREIISNEDFYVVSKNL